MADVLSTTLDQRYGGNAGNTIANAFQNAVGTYTNTPFQQYNGLMTAGTNMLQQGAQEQNYNQTAYQAPQVMAGDVNRYSAAQGLQGAQSYQSQRIGAGSLNGANLSGYINPYTQQVLGQNLSELNRQLATTNQAANGNAAMSGAFGGDRAAIVNTENARNANTIASNLINTTNQQAYQNAQGLATSDLNRQLTADQSNQQADLSAQGLRNSASGTLGQLGVSQSQLDLQGSMANQNASLQAQQARQAAINAQYSMGTQQQQTYQNDLTNQYGQFQRQVQFPYQQQQGIQSAAGTYGPLLSQQTQFAPSTASQAIGYGTAALGALGLAGGSGGIGGALGSIGSGVSGAYNWLTGGSGGANADATTAALQGLGGSYGPETAAQYNDALSGLGSTGSSLWNTVSSWFADGGAVQGYAGGGSVDDDVYLPAYTDTLDGVGGQIGIDARSPPVTQRLPVPGYPGQFSGGDRPPAYDRTGSIAPVETGYDAPPDTSTLDATMERLRAEQRQPAPPSTVAAPAIPMTAEPATPAGNTAALFTGNGSPSDGVATPAAPAAPPSRVEQSANPGAGLATAVQAAAPRAAAQNNWAMPVLSAGLGMLAGDSPFAGVNIGRGGMAGLQTYNQEPQRALQAEQLKAAQFSNRITEAKQALLYPALAASMTGAGTGLGGASAQAGGVGSSVQIPVQGANGQQSSAAGFILTPQTLLQRAKLLQDVGDEGNAIKLRDQAQKMIESGFAMDAAGNIAMLPGFLQSKGALESVQAAIKTQAAVEQTRLESPYKIAEARARQEGRVVDVGGIATTGYQVNRAAEANPAPTTDPRDPKDPWQTYAGKTVQVENPTGNPAAKNPDSSATGNGQFIDSTWLDQMRKTRPDLVAGKTPQQILAMRADPALSQDMTISYGKENAQVLASAGMPVNASTVRLAHWFGPEGAQKILRADPSTPMAAIVGQDVAKINGVAGMTAGAVAQRIVSKFGIDPLTTARRTSDMFGAPDTAPQKASFQPGPAPAEDVPSVTQPPPDLPVDRSAMGTPRLIPTAGGLTSSVTPSMKAAQEAAGKVIGATPERLNELDASRTQLVSINDTLKRQIAGPEFLKTGFAADTRQEAAKAYNLVAGTLGIPKLAEGAIADNTALGKEATRLAFALAKSVGGARVALGEVMQANRASPSNQNDMYGNVVMTNMLLQDNVRQTDRTRYVLQQTRNGANADDAAAAFDRVNPATRYIGQALGSAVETYFPQQIPKLVAAPTVENIEGFNRRYGDGAAQAILARHRPRS